MTTTHPDDEFHSPTSDDPYWTETSWFTFAVPSRRISGQLYPYFLPNLGVVASAAYFWDDTGDQLSTCLYAKNFWHLPIPDQPLSNIALASGLRYRCISPSPNSVWELGYRDPDGDEVSVALRFTALTPPNYLGDWHLDQPGHYEGTVVIDGETIEVDDFGFRDRSWCPRPQFGFGLLGSLIGYNGYSYGTASAKTPF